jgi:Zn-dependent protease with chaperone function
MERRTVASAGAFGDYYDGQTALRQRVALSVQTDEEGTALAMDLPDGEHMVLWPVDLVRTLPDQSSYDTLTVGLSTRDPARLVVRDAGACAMVAEHCPLLHKPLLPPRKWRAALTVAALGATAIVLLFTVFLPALSGVLAGRLSTEAEVAMGAQNFEMTRASFAGFGEEPLQICAAPAGVAALQKLADRVGRDMDLPFPVQLAVLDDRANPIPNAYALPGGYITFFNTMIAMAEDPDEIAAVYAHELGHVVLDHSVKGVLQNMTTLALISLLAGDVSGGGVLAWLGTSYISSGYSRSAETEADVFAGDTLNAVGLPPAALGRLFSRMQEEGPEVTGIMAHFMSHPELADRIAAAARADRGTASEPALSPREWADLRDICSVTRP